MSNKRYYRIIEDGYIPMIGVGHGGEEITKEEYDEINAVIHNKPDTPEGYDYRLLADLTWELYEMPAPDPDAEISDEEALDIILGVSE